MAHKSAAPKFSELNEDLIAKVLHHIEEDTKRYDQNIIGLRILDMAPKKKAELLKDQDLKEKDFPDCGTKCCFGGWVLFLSTPANEIAGLFNNVGDMKSDSLSKAAKLLGLNYEEHCYLFDGTDGNNPRNNLRIIKDRLHEIRTARQLRMMDYKLGVEAEQIDKHLKTLKARQEEISELIENREAYLPEPSDPGYRRTKLPKE